MPFSSQKYLEYFETSIRHLQRHHNVLWDLTATVKMIGLQRLKIAFKIVNIRGFLQ